MSYEDKETSVAGGEPVFLLRFSDSENNAYYYTTIDEDITLTGSARAPYIVPDWEGPIVFEATAIRSDEIRSGGEVAQGKLGLVFPPHHPLPQSLVTPFFTRVQALTIWRAHRGLYDEPFVVWKGRVVGATTNDRSGTTVDCENFFTTVQMIGLRAKYQKYCRHALYGRGCGVDYDTFKIEGTMIEIDGGIGPGSAFNRVRIGGGDVTSKPDGYFRGGILDIDGNYNYIVRHEGEWVTLLMPMSWDMIGGLPRNVFVAPGCDLSIQTCHVRFDNKFNHGGFPFIPDKSPYGGSAIHMIGS